MTATAPLLPQADPHRDGSVAILERWDAVFSALSPLIGVLGVVALYRRSLQLARADHPFLADAISAGLPESADLSRLADTLQKRTPAEADAADAAMRASFSTLLGALIGPALTDRLLEPSSSHSQVANDATDTAP